jgi:hypothetical protein
MYVKFSQAFRTFALPCIIILLMGYAGVTDAQTSADAVAINPAKAQTDLLITGNKGSEFQLEVRQLPLAQVLEAITAKTHVPIHYSVLPEGLVTATCVGTTLKQVLECLLDRKADLIVRNPLSPVEADSTGQGQAAEVWILGSRLAGSQHNANCIATTGRAADKVSLILRQNEIRQNEKNAEAEPDRTDELLKTAQSKNPAERAQAIGALLADGRQDDPVVKATLERALTDQDANVRAQAISSLAHREAGGAAAGAIQEALRDSSEDVRLMAVDGISDDIPLLQQAINDSDETVRTLAAVKLEQLIQGNGAAK